MNYFDLISKYKVYKDRLRFYKVRKPSSSAYNISDGLVHESGADKTIAENKASSDLITIVLVISIIAGIYFWKFGMGTRGLIHYAVIVVSIIGSMIVRKSTHKAICYLEDNDERLAYLVTLRRCMLALAVPLLAPYFIAFLEGMDWNKFYEGASLNRAFIVLNTFRGIIRYLILILIVADIYLIFVLRQYMLFRKLLKRKKDIENNLSESIMPASVADFSTEWYEGWIVPAVAIIGISLLSAFVGVFTTFRI